MRDDEPQPGDATGCGDRAIKFIAILCLVLLGLAALLYGLCYILMSGHGPEHNG